MKKILALWDYNSFTGFATVSKNIKKQIKNHFGENIQFDICAINYFGDPYQEDDGSFVVSALKSATKRDDFGRYGFLKILSDSDEYDGIFILQDLAIVVPIIEVLKHIKSKKKAENKKSFKSIFYFPVDNSLLKRNTEGLEFFDLLVTYTDYGRKQVLNHRPDLQGKIKVVPHGNNSKDFYPISDAEIHDFRLYWFGEMANKFIVTNLNRNQNRKDIPSTVFAFVEAKRILKYHGIDQEVMLYLHMNPKDPMGWDLPILFQQTDLVEGVDYLLMKEEDAVKGVDTDTVNKIYNATNLYISTTLGEGWGLSVTESFATKTPVMCPLHTSLTEITDNGKRAWVHETILPCCHWKENIVRHQVNPLLFGAEMAKFIAKYKQGIVDDEAKNEYNNKIEAAYKYSQSIDWREVCKKWVEYFKEIYKI